MSTKEARDQKDSVRWRVGRANRGNETHLVDFDTDSMRARLRDEPDRMLCGMFGDFEPADGEPVTCSRCQKRMAQNAITIVEVPEE